MTQEQLNQILSLAIQSPSGDNCQPWKFRWHGEILEIFHDFDRSRHRLDMGKNASILALGCLIEAIAIAADKFKYMIGIQRIDPRTDDFKWAEIQFKKISVSRDLILSDGLVGRHTNRSLYRGGNLRKLMVDDTLFAESLKASQGPAKLYWTQELSPELVDYLVDAESLLWEDPLVARDLLRWVRFSQKEAIETRDGLPWKNLGLGFLDSRALKLARKYPRLIEVLRRAGATQKSSGQLRKQLESSAGLVCFTVPKISSSSIFELAQAGRLGFRVWVRLNQLGFGVQPLTIASLNVYNIAHENLHDYFLPEFIKIFQGGELILSRAFQFSDSEIPVWMFRTGVSSPLGFDKRTLRLELSQVLS